jgi:hypothetical protein
VAHWEEKKKAHLPVNPFRISLTQAGVARTFSKVTTNGVSVVDGIFTTAMSFGLGPFSSGAPHWLEIGVRTNGGRVFGTIAPRTPLTLLNSVRHATLLLSLSCYFIRS